MGIKPKRRTPIVCTGPDMLENPTPARTNRSTPVKGSSRTCANAVQSPRREDIREKRIVLKIGTSTLVDSETGHLAIARISRVIEIVSKLRAMDYQVALVSSGAIGCGSMRLGIKERPKSIAKKQALAAVGQNRLMSFYDDLFKATGIISAQILLSYANFDNRGQYDNTSKCLEELFKYGCVPIVNENDTTAVEEIRVGDNDTLSAFVANMISAQWLFLVTDVDGLYDKPPSRPGAKRLPCVENIEDLAVDIGGAGSGFGTGGMATKLRAAKLSVACGVKVVILSNDHIEKIPEVLDGSLDYGTQFLTSVIKLVRHRKRWILSIRPQGKIFLDDGAVKAVKKKKGLFPIGVIRVEGNFGFRDIIALHSATGKEVGKGIANFTADDCRKLLGCHGENMSARLGYIPPTDYLVSRENIAVYDLAAKDSPLRWHPGAGTEEVLPERSEETGLDVKKAFKKRRNWAEEQAKWIGDDHTSNESEASPNVVAMSDESEIQVTPLITAMSHSSQISLI